MVIKVFDLLLLSFCFADGVTGPETTNKQKKCLFDNTKDSKLVIKWLNFIKIIKFHMDVIKSLGEL